MHEAVGKVILLLVSGTRPEVVRAAAVERLGIPEAEVEEAIAEARRLITLTADYNRDERLGQAIARCDSVYNRAVSANPADLKVALSAQEKLNRLFGFYRPEAREPVHEGGEAAMELDAARDHLAALFPEADDETPTGEIARLAAAEIMQARAVPAAKET